MPASFVELIATPTALACDMKNWSVLGAKFGHFRIFEIAQSYLTSKTLFISLCPITVGANPSYIKLYVSSISIGEVKSLPSRKLRVLRRIAKIGSSHSGSVIVSTTPLTFLSVSIAINCCSPNAATSSTDDSLLISAVNQEA